MECKVRGLGGQVQSVECKVQSAECKVRSVESEREMWSGGSVKCFF